MHKIKLSLAYDGTNYRGFQFQEGLPTIEGAIYTALRELLPKEANKIKLVGASRTDAGVHALGNVICFETESSIPAERFCYALNPHLPEDIKVLESALVSDDFHPRYQPHNKHYLYRIDRNYIPNPLNRLYCYSYSFPLDLENMKKAAKLLEGEHDFRSFVNPDSQVFQHGGDAIRTIHEIRIEERDILNQKEIHFHISGNGFLYHMIRIIVGTLLQVGGGKISPSRIKNILDAKDRTLAGPTVPAKGLCLMYLDYLHL